ncbi:Phosphate acetyltransferase [Sporomusa silvacetica DSM 10669]|uniref:Phosphate acetyltransferase n=1 Tax=Sporomusa silvacetica DSM 10669 TaxID=1123289 RepID=A0ABZ3IKW3_9FIRM|nr:phosphate butyryltransferase [Sporomusa silvacetica]OZC13449.1 phosphate acetyltransferase [Sporomusa silvacetica DSM 10669]
MFEKIIADARKSPKIVAVAAAQDMPVLEAVFAALEQGIAIPLLVGDEAKIRTLASEIGIDLTNITVINELEPAKAALRASRLVRDGQADFLMKGLLQTAELLRAVLDKENGLRSGSLLSHVGIFEANSYDRLLLLTDAAMVMYPDLKQKVELIQNAVTVARSMGVERPKVAGIAAVEVVNLNMPPTLDAAILTQMNRRGQIRDCLVDGPLQLDTAISAEAARHKGIKGSEVAGHADILLAPNIETGNAIYKTINQMTSCQIAALIIGASAPIVLTSRADSARTKLLSIACASRLALYLKS